MSFLRALRAYIGLGPDDEIEDRYLAELNARRRELALDEIHPDGHPVEVDDLDEGAYRPVADGRGREVDADELLDELIDDGDDLDDGAEFVVSGRNRPERTARSRGFADRLAGVEGFDPDDELDLAFIERMEAAGGVRPGRHDIEPDAPLEAVVDDGGEPVQVRARTGTAVADENAVVRSLDSMRAKPRTLLPESFADAKIVADEFKRDIPVVLNLQSVERDLARRLIDFASGICYVLDGSMEKMASQVFLLIPESVEVSEEDRRRIEERGYAR